jgi:hypothetical protein
MKRIKKFYRDHGDVLWVLAGATIGGGLAGAYAVNKAIAETKAGCLIEHVWFEGDIATVLSRNGDLNRYDMGPLQDLATLPVP